MSEWRYADIGGDEILVRRTIGNADPVEPATAFEINDGDSVVVLAHKLPEMVRAIYACAGLPVPDLPDIPDPALVEDLAADLARLAGSPTSQEHRRRALILFDAGWRKDGVL